MSDTEIVAPGPVVIRRGEGEAIWHLGSLVEILLDGPRTGGALALVETLGPAGMQAPPHVHSREDETFLVVEGTVSFTVGGATSDAGPGTVVHLPRGVPHAFRVVSPTARLQNLIAPAGFEDFFRQLSEPAPRRAIPPAGAGMAGLDRLPEVCAGFGVTLLV
jgi:quercetin dioxygenase-like cupin family protein